MCMQLVKLAALNFEGVVNRMIASSIEVFVTSFLMKMYCHESGWQKPAVRTFFKYMKSFFVHSFINSRKALSET